ncbi:hypothetical protein [Microbacterium sp.]|nr:hypothetical protein [Microbacterium sp.]
MGQTHDAVDESPLVEDTSGMRFAFWTWAGIVAVGLTVMITLPLAGL